MSFSFERLDSAWKTTCRTLFGEEVGPLSDFEPYLKESLWPYQETRSSLSGQPLLIGGSHYPPDARFISQDEVSGQKIQPLDINSIKDLDSLLQAAGERTLFCGNKLFGKSFNVSRSDHCSDSTDLYGCHTAVYNVRSAAFCSMVRESQFIFGVSSFVAQSAIRCLYGNNLVRGFETYHTNNSSDTYFTMNCDGCQECLFGFNLRNQRHTIGNLQLPRDQYASLKKKLLSEMAERLRKDKRLFSMADIANIGVSSAPEEERELPPLPVSAPVEEAFSKTMKLILQHPHSNLQKFCPWLNEKTGIRSRLVAGANGQPAYKIDYQIEKYIPARRLLPLSQALESARHSISLDPSESPSLDEIVSRAAKTVYFCQEYQSGQVEDVVETPTVFNGVHLHHVLHGTNSQYGGFAGLLRDSQYTFGGHITLQYRFCVNCYDSINLTACFESDSCYTCSYCLFCHNCENCQDALFCFNAKGLRYAVCNVEVGKERYLQIKQILLDEINSQLEKTGRLDFSVYSPRRSKHKKN